METDVRSALRSYFGFSEFRPGQQAVIDSLLAGQSAAAVFPTGGGKSLCYQLPALLLPGVTLVVSPLIALMKDQIDALAARGIAAKRLDSTLSLDEYRATMRDVRNGTLRMLYVAPERFQNERFREMLRQARVSLFAVDEAHCISEWGHNFRPDYLKLVEFSRQCGAERVLALTATATPAVLEDICRAFQIDRAHAVRTGFYRANLTLLATPVSDADRDELLESRLSDRPAGPTIVYVTLQRTAEEVAERLASAGFEARPYHAGLETDERTRVQDWFFSSSNPIVVATIAFGMGIDKSDIRYVYHYNLPKSLENYSQEVGRSGRDGAPSVCEMFVCLADLNALENFAYGDTPSRRSVESLIRELFSLETNFDVNYIELSNRHDIRLLVVRTLMTYLELDGYLEGGTPFYAGYKVKPLKPSQAILDKFDGERREFLDRLFRQFKKAKTWLHVDAEAAARAIGATRDRVIRALDYLAEQGWLEVEAQGVRNQYRRVREAPDPTALANELFTRTVERERREIARIHQMLDLVQGDRCQVAALGEYFGESLERDCGHCSWCLSGGSAEKSKPRGNGTIDERIVEQALKLRKERGPELSDSRAMARFLCGVTSPALTRAKLSTHRLFGALTDAPFDEVRKRFE